MSRYQLQTEDGKVHYLDAEIEQRVQALEEAVIALQEHLGLAASQEIAASLQESAAFRSSLQEEELRLQEISLSMRLEEEALEIMPGALEESAE